MPQDAQSLFTQARCYECLGLSAYQVMKLGLLAQISTNANPENATDPTSLISQGRCLGCAANANIGQIMELALLTQIANSS